MLLGRQTGKHRRVINLSGNSDFFSALDEKKNGKKPSETRQVSRDLGFCTTPVLAFPIQPRRSDPRLGANGLKLWVSPFFCLTARSIRDEIGRYERDASRHHLDVITFATMASHRKLGWNVREINTCLHSTWPRKKCAYVDKNISRETLLSAGKRGQLSWS